MLRCRACGNARDSSQNKQSVVHPICLPRVRTAHAGRLWDRRMEKVVHEYKGHSQDTVGCAFLPSSKIAGCRDGQAVATVSKDQTLRIWDRETAENVRCSMSEAGMFTALHSPSPESGSGGDGPCYCTTTFWGGVGV